MSDKVGWASRSLTNAVVTVSSASMFGLGCPINRKTVSRRSVKNSLGLRKTQPGLAMNRRM